jgi:hypothetical protein
MLSDEEKKAIEIIKFLQDKCIQENGTGMMSIYRIDDLANAIKILLNLIEKQSKEIEELKSQIDEHVYNGCDYELCNKKWNDKIKAKIEEYDDKGMTINLTNRSAGKTFQQAVHYEVKKILQSLLEKE